MLDSNLLLKRTLVRIGRTHGSANIPMTSAIKAATIKENQVISTLLQPYLDAYWRENVRYPYLLYSENEVAGFALVRQNGEHWEMAEFCILPKFSRRGLATACAVDIFRKHLGKREIQTNQSCTIVHFVHVSLPYPFRHQRFC